MSPALYAHMASGAIAGVTPRCARRAVTLLALVCVMACNREVRRSDVAPTQAESSPPKAMDAAAGQKIAAANQAVRAALDRQGWFELAFAEGRPPPGEDGAVGCARVLNAADEVEAAWQALLRAWPEDAPERGVIEAERRVDAARAREWETFCAHRAAE